jgi:NADH dehydrogenase (ubiquinone) 1 alpha subcomplex subunit 9
VLVPYRGDEHDTRHLKVMGDYGQIVMAPYHLKDEASIAHVSQHANVVVNLVGQESATRNFSLEEANVEGTRRIAKAAKDAGVQRFIHVSAMAARPDSISGFCKSKAESEAVVKEIFPDATILRPGSMFGPEDRFLARIAGQAQGAPVFPLIAGAQAKRTPIFYNDVAEAIMICMRDPATIGKTYDLGGPSVYTLEEVYQQIFDMVGAKPFTLSVPPALLAPLGRVAQMLPTMPLTQDEVYRAQEDEVITGSNLTCADLGLEPVTMESRIGNILLRFKPAEISAKDAGVLL